MQGDYSIVIYLSVMARKHVKQVINRQILAFPHRHINHKQTTMTKEKVVQIIKDKVTGKWVAEHTDTQHFYRNVDSGVLVSSVTTKNILDKEHLRPWAVRVAIEWLEKDDRWNKYLTAKTEPKNEYLQGAILAHTGIRDDAGQVGTFVHDAAERFILEWIETGTKPDDIIRFIDEKGKDDGRVWAGARSVKKLFDDRPEVVPVASELLVGSAALNGAGTLDLLVLNGKDLELWDFKTSNSIDKIGYSMQVAAYSSMFTTMTGLRPKAWRVVKISKDMDKVEIHRLVNYKKALECFKAISKVYDLIKSSAFTLERDVQTIKL